MNTNANANTNVTNSKRGGKPQDKIDFNISQSFIINEFTHLDDFLNAVDDRVNIKIAQGIKKAMQLVIEKLEQLIQSKVKLIVQDQITQPEYWSSKNSDLQSLVKDEVNQRIQEIMNLKNANMGTLENNIVRSQNQ